MVTKEEILKIAKLSKLHIEDIQVEKYQNDLNDILNYMEQLNELDLTEVKPLYSVHELDIVFNKDEVCNEMDKKEFLENSPKHDENFISLPVMVGDSNE